MPAPDRSAPAASPPSTDVPHIRISARRAGPGRTGPGALFCLRRADNGGGGVGGAPAAAQHRGSTAGSADQPISLARCATALRAALGAGRGGRGSGAGDGAAGLSRRGAGVRRSRRRSRGGAGRGLRAREERGQGRALCLNGDCSVRGDPGEPRNGGVRGHRELREEGEHGVSAAPKGGEPQQPPGEAARGPREMESPERWRAPTAGERQGRAARRPGSPQDTSAVGTQYGRGTASAEMLVGRGCGNWLLREELLLELPL